MFLSLEIQLEKEERGSFMFCYTAGPRIMFSHSNVDELLCRTLTRVSISLWLNRFPHTWVLQYAVELKLAESTPMLSEDLL